MLQPSEEIKSRLDIVEVLREYIQLKPAGLNFRALCPFHREKTPSLMVSPEKQIWHCFGCGKGGDIFSFVMEMEGLSFVEALRLLAPKAGVELKRTDPALSSQRNRLLDIMAEAVRYYERALKEDGRAGHVRDYLAGRGLKKETIARWQIGYSPDSWDDLLLFLKSKGYKENEIFLAGLLVRSESGGRFYNRFRGRIMFPINDFNGNPVAFSARVDPAREAEEKMGKYINSPQTAIYDKSRIVFGLDKAKLAIKQKGEVIVVEGQMDAITAHQNGFANVVASSGTALTISQLNLLKRYTNNILLAFDMDSAGQAAVKRGIAEALSLALNVKIITIPLGKDPDECLRTNPAAWQEAVGKAQPIMLYYFSKVFSGLDLSQVEQKRAAVRELLPVIKNLGDRIEQEFWLRELSEKVEIEEKTLREILGQLKERTEEARGEKEKKEAGNFASKNRYEMLSELLLALILKFPFLLDYTLNHLETAYLFGEDKIFIYRNLVMYYNNFIESKTEEAGRKNSPWFDYKSFLSRLNGLPEEKREEQAALLNKLVLLGEREFYEHDFARAKQEAASLVLVLKREYLLSRLKEIEKLIFSMEKEGEKEKAKILAAEFKSLSEEIKNLGN